VLAGNTIETVLIPVVREEGQKSRLTLCVSTQVRTTTMRAAAMKEYVCGSNTASHVRLWSRKWY